MKNGKIMPPDRIGLITYENDDGQYHRLDGPACNCGDKFCFGFYIEHIGYAEEDYWKHPYVIAYAQQQEVKTLLGLKDE